jgi:acyl-CoA synthetase (NDP forming)
VADVLAAVGEQSDKPIVSTFLAREGVPELLRVPDVAGAAGRGSVPSYTSPEAAVRTLARVVAYASWLARPAGSLPDHDHHVDRAVDLVHGVLAAAPTGAELTYEQLRELLAAYGIDLWRRLPVTCVDEAVAAGDELGWDVVLKASADHLRTRPDLAHVWRSIGDAAEMRSAWPALIETVGDPVTARFVVQRMAPPGVPLSLESLEDPLFGPIVSFGVQGAPSELLGDRSYRIPPLTDVDTEAMVREIGAAPLLFGYRGGDQVDIAAVCDLLQRLAQLKDDVSEVARLDLDLVLAGPHGASVLDACGQVAPTPQGRSDRYVRRMQPVAVGDTAAG